MTLHDHVNLDTLNGQNQSIMVQFPAFLYY